MSKTTIEIDKKIQQLRERRALLISRELTAQRKKHDREAKEIGLWLIKNYPDHVLKLKQRMREGSDESSLHGPQ